MNTYYDVFINKYIYTHNLFNVLKSYGYDENLCTVSDFLNSIDMDSNPDYVNRVSMSKKIINDTRKKKAKNEYLDFRNKDKEFINYLKDYHSNYGFSKYNERVG